jgi:hypothetical protein
VFLRELNSAEIEFLMTLGPKAKELYLGMECEIFPEKMLPVLKKLVLSLSGQLSHVLFCGRLVDTEHIATIVEALLSNPKLNGIAFSVQDGAVRLTQVSKITYLVKKSSKISSVDLLHSNIFFWGDWIDGWSPENIIHSFGFSSKERTDWKADGLCSLLSNCPNLRSLAISSLTCDQSQFTEVIEAVASLSKIEEFGFEVIEQCEPSFFAGDISQLLSRHKLKILNIPQFCGALRNDSLKVLRVCSSSDADPKFILADNPNLETLDISSVLGGQVSHFLAQLSVNQTLTTLKLGGIKHHDGDFVQLFSLLRNNTSLELSLTVQVESCQQLIAVSGYLESNLGGIEFLKLVAS